jgi:hypothetical protein
LVADVVDRYRQTVNRLPRRLVVHKQSRFFPDELAGFQDSLHDYEYDLVALAQSTRLMRHDEYPPPRGACVSLGDRRYLYTTGYVPSLGRYPHGHVPTSVQITDHVGDSDAQSLLREILLLTKMNWNSARVAEKLPVTVRFRERSRRYPARPARRLHAGGAIRLLYVRICLRAGRGQWTVGDTAHQPPAGSGRGLTRSARPRHRRSSRWGTRRVASADQSRPATCSASRARSISAVSSVSGSRCATVITDIWRTGLGLGERIAEPLARAGQPVNCLPSPRT